MKYNAGVNKATLMTTIAMVCMLMAVMIAEGATEQEQFVESVQLKVCLRDKQIVSGGPILVDVSLQNVSKNSLDIVEPGEWMIVQYYVRDSNGQTITKLYPYTGDVEMPRNYADCVRPGKKLVFYDNLSRLFKTPLKPGTYEVTAFYTIPKQVEASLHGPVYSAPVKFTVRPSSIMDQYVYGLIADTKTADKEDNANALTALRQVAKSNNYRGVHAPYIMYYVGCMLHKFQKYNEALEVLITVADEHKDNKFFYIATAREIGNIYINLKDYDKAADWWESMPASKKSLSIAETLRNKTHEINEKL